ncbi:MAG: polyribonucleotide nucleotidyltransferase [Actinomycetota bacterium]|nr:polyribonucleotide nucleotidyltransferase [Actinomycetota bacterium]
MGYVEKEFEISGRKITLETGKLAKQADGSVVVSCGGTSVLSTVVASEEAREVDFLPLTVDVEEKLYAAGKIPGSFLRREGRPADSSMLSARIIDRSIRPNFSHEFRNETQIVITTLSTDQVNPPDVLGLLGACAALSISDIPFDGPLSGARIAMVQGKWIVNPTFKETDEATLNLTVAGNDSSIVMVEAGASEVRESEVIEGLSFGQGALGKLCEFIDVFSQEARQSNGKKQKESIQKEITLFVESKYLDASSKLMDAFDKKDTGEIERAFESLKNVSVECKLEFPENKKFAQMLSNIHMQRTLNNLLKEKIRPYAFEPLKKALIDSTVPGLTKEKRANLRKEAQEKLSEQFVSFYAGLENAVKDVFAEFEREILRELIIEKSIRPDGRKPDQIRKISCEVGFLARTHGSALFTRGETQVLTIVTLGGYGEKQMLDDLGVEEYKRFIHHYNFPPFCTGEARPIRGPKRREIGHGALVERALLPVVPEEEDFPYTTRVVSEVLESNGSSSMASVCASSLALMDAGVPLKGGKAVTGIAMGLVLEDARHVILSDIQGIEDNTGDMDFKVAGTEEGITALQMDIKCSGLTPEILQEALEKAKDSRLFILTMMSKAIDKPRSEISPNAPRMLQVCIPVDRIGDLIGPGGKNIRSLIEKFNVDIDV